MPPKTPVLLSQIVTASNTGRGSAAGQRKLNMDRLVLDHPEIMAASSKAINSRDPGKYTTAGTKETTAPDNNYLQNVANVTARNASEAGTVMQMLPDTEMMAQILISSVLSPKDQMTLELTYNAPAGVLPTSIAAACLQTIKEHMQENYKIKDKLPRMMREIMFTKGSHVVAILAENAVDELINRRNTIALESYEEVLSQEVVKNRNLLGNPDGQAKASKLKGMSMPALESYSDSAGIRPQSEYQFRLSLNRHPEEVKKKISVSAEALTDDYVHVTDNPSILRVNLLDARVRKDRVAEALKTNGLQSHLKIAIESHSSGAKVDDRSLASLIYKERRPGWREFQSVKGQEQLKRISIGQPLIMELPSESVIPVFTPGQEERHVGYFVLLDQTGHPIKLENFKDSFRELSNRFNFANTSQTSNVINRLKQLTEGFDCNNQQHLDRSVQIYTDIVEQDFLARLRNGIYGNNISISKNDDFYRVMLSRTLAQQNTTVLFLPVEAVAYYALKYNQHGIGVSYMDEMKVLNNMSAILMFTDTMKSIKNAIGRIGVNVQIDPDTPDWEKTAEQIMHELMRLNQNAMPLGVDSPADIVTYLQRAQYHFNFEGHEGMPATKVTFDESQTNYSQTDREFQEDLNRRRYMAVGLNAETVNNGFNQETATSVLTNNLMLSRRVMMIQDQLNPAITDHHRKVMRVDEDLLTKLRTQLMQSYEELQVDEAELKKKLGDNCDVKSVVVNYILSDFIEGMDVSLPRPNTATVANQKAAMEEYLGLLTMAVEHFLSDKFFTDEIAGAVSSEIEALKEMLISHFMRMYMAENGILPELASIATLGEDSKPELDLWEMQSDFMAKLSKTLSKFLLRVSKAKKASDKIAESLKNGDDSTDAFSSSSDSSSDSASGGDDLGMGGGLDDLGMDDLDAGAGNKPPESIEDTDSQPADNPAEPRDDGASGDEKPQ